MRQLEGADDDDVPDDSFLAQLEAVPLVAPGITVEVGALRTDSSHRKGVLWLLRIP